SLRQPLTTAQLAAFHALVERRLRREPTAYIVGHKEFYDLELEVTPAALIPRPETEVVVEEALRLERARPRESLRVVDVGTGCAAIALALAKHLPNAQVVATDVSAEALALAYRNAQRLGLAQSVQWVLADLLAGLRGPFDLIVANMPYVKINQWPGLAPEIRLYEPRLALDGGDDGLRCIRRLLAEAPQRLAAGGAIVLEMGWEQREAVVSLAQAFLPGASVEIKRDLGGLERVAVIVTAGAGRPLAREYPQSSAIIP
ncbi:MAG: peptide chain release factor N(5)-glutamine methyltransferase, partial [Dehalococcoidia bacterium]